MSAEVGTLLLIHQRLSSHILGAILIVFHIVCSTSGAFNHFSTKSPNDDVQIPDIVNFELPGGPPEYHPGDGFGHGIIDLGGLEVYQAKFFKTVWLTKSGGPKDTGVSFYEPILIPPGHKLLGHYGRPNSVPLYAAVLTAKDTSFAQPVLAKPLNYRLVWTSKGLDVKTNVDGYIWIPIAPIGYKAVGYIVTNSSVKPSLDKVSCVRSDFTASLEVDTWLWGLNVFNVYSTRPIARGPTSLSVPTGTFWARIGDGKHDEIACLKRSSQNNLYSAMPNSFQIGVMIQAYAPWLYFHPRERFLPSSVLFYFENGATICKVGRTPTAVTNDGDNLPAYGTVDDAYLDLPVDKELKEKVKNGDLGSAVAYIHVKPALGGTFTDLAIWLYYPFNGAGRLQFGPLNIDLRVIGEHVSDWEHITLRVDNFHGNLKAVYLSQHAAGTWVNALEFEYQNGTRPVVYASLHGHAHYATATTSLRAQVEMDSRDLQSVEEFSKEFETDSKGIITRGEIFLGFGVREDTAKGNHVMDIASNYQVVRVDHDVFDMEPWVKYTGRWGPKFSYSFTKEVINITDDLPEKLRDVAIQLLYKLPPELLGEEGPEGPAMKANWAGDEKVRF